MEKIGIGVLAYSARAYAMMDAWLRSGYDVELYIFDKQKNPQNRAIAKRHVVAENLNNPKEAIEFFGQYKDEITFIMPDGEGPILAGLRDEVEAELEIPCICPTKEYAIEGYKVAQRELIERFCKEANPRHQIFHPGRPKHLVKDDFYKWGEELDWQFAIKPNKSGYGKGVGVWGDHFNTPEQAFEHFWSIYEAGDLAIVEEKLEGEEFSLEFLSDGRIILPTFATRDYKRRKYGDKDQNTGGMGSYKDRTRRLPFMTSEDWMQAVTYTNRLFEALRGNSYNPNLRGPSMYMAFMSTKDGVKILEINSRFGDPESMTWLRTLKRRTNFVDLCLAMTNGTLRRIAFEDLASVVTYLVRPDYGGGERKPVDTTIDINEALKVAQSYGDNGALFVGAVKERDGGSYEALGPRNVAACGYAKTVGEARFISRKILEAVKGDLENREDIGSEEYIQQSIDHMKKLRG